MVTWDDLVSQGWTVEYQGKQKRSVYSYEANVSEEDLTMEEGIMRKVHTMMKCTSYTEIIKYIPMVFF